MISAARVGVGLTSMAGISSAVAVPLTTMNAHNDSSSLIGGGSSKPEHVLGQCNFEGRAALKEVTYKDNGTKDVCGQIVSENERNIQSSGEEYTSLFNDLGNTKKENVTLANSGNGTTVCVDNTQNPWLLFSEGNGTQYLGLCNTSKISETKFIKKVQESSDNKSSSKFLICEKDCGDSTEKLENNKSVLKEEREKEGSGSEIKFYDDTREEIDSELN